MLQYVRERGPAAITNSKGIPGTLGCIARTLHDGQLVALSTWHVLFGEESAPGGDVWLVRAGGKARHVSLLGRTLYAKIGVVRFRDEPYYVDCAVCSCLTERAEPFLAGYDLARPGDLVAKAGAATGITTGIVVDIRYSDVVWINGRPWSAPGQILIKPTGGAAVFAAAGDSGALVAGASGKAVGLLWGRNVRGEGVASPIEPVLYAMNITLGNSP